ncbi:MAG: thiolase family protein [Dongiaceae bacterium]
MAETDRDVVVLGVARTPFGRFGGKLEAAPTAILAARTIDTLLARTGVDPARIDSVYAGVGMIGAGVLTPARQAVLRSALPAETPSLTVDRACCSGMTAIGLGWKDIKLGLADLVICGGAENLSGTPFLWPRQRGSRPGPVDVRDPLMLRADFLDKAIAAYTGEEALRFGVDREQQDAWAVQSHQRYFAADAAGYFDVERFPWPAERGNAPALEADESPRRDATPEKLATLKTVYGSPTVTAGNAPGLNDGAAFLLLGSRAIAKALGAEPLATIADYVQVADGPTSGSYTPAIAIGKLLRRADRKIETMRLIEINEAFAATPLVSTLRLADSDRKAADRLRERTNLHGGAVALGHPLGASGARLAMTLINGLRRAGGGEGVTAICGGYGQGDGLLLKVA